MTADDRFKVDPLPDPTEPFDVVYTWVNHVDAHWKAMHARATNNRIAPAREHVSANDPARYADHGELYWSIQSVRKYAPWVRRIHVVTNCAMPLWAAGMADVIHVPHELVFPDSTCLPTFNAFAIETVLHRVPGVSKRFLYFNDDFFLCRAVRPEDFFQGADGVRYTPSPHDIPYERPVDELRPVDTGAINAGNLLLRDFSFRPKKKLQHTPYPLSVEILEEIEDKYKNEVLITRSHAFRSAEDLAMSTNMHAYYAQCIGLAEISALRTRYVDIGDWRFLGLVHPLAPLWRGQYDTLCLNEVQQIRHGRKLRDMIVYGLMQQLFD